MTGEDFYVTGGTLRPDAPSYVERQADKDFCEGLLDGEFCYVLTARQMGKSSLMVRTVKRLRQEGVAVAVLDLTAIGQNVTAAQWYDGLMARLGQQLNLEDELEAFWEAHPELGPLQRWLTALETVVLQHVASKIVLFVDEIDVVRSLPFSTDEFFAAIRECFNRRSREPAFGRLAFGLLGVATPTDLIRDPRMTPFNVGRRIELLDFSMTEAAPLARGLGTDEGSASRLLARVLYWTGGHPYLTQRLCRALCESLRSPPLETPTDVPLPPLLPTTSMVDRLAEKLFLSRQARDRDDNLIFVRERILRSEVDVAGLLYLYRKIQQGQRIPDDETNPLVSVLRLSGITRGADGFLKVRNRIYAQVFDAGWVQTNMPEAEVRRQRRAGRRGVLTGLGIGVLLLLAYLFFGPLLRRYKDARLAYQTTQSIVSAYRQLQSYEDQFESTLDFSLGGTLVTATASGSLAFEKPNKLSLVLKSRLHQPQLEIQLLSDGKTAWACLPAQNQYQELGALPAGRLFAWPKPIAQNLGPLRVAPVYRLLLGAPEGERFPSAARNLRYVRTTELNGSPVRVLTWDHEAGAFFRGLGVTNSTPRRETVPVTVWVDSLNGLVVQAKVDLTRWARQLMADSAQPPITTLMLREAHRSISTTPTPESAPRSQFAPGAADRAVAQLDVPPPSLSTLAARERRFAKLIPPRLPQVPRTMIELSDYYNAALVQSWHDTAGGSLTLETLPAGLLQLGGVAFDVRGVVQLSGNDLAKSGGRYPQQITGIPIRQRCRQLHFLHATGWKERDGRQIGSYVVHYASGEETTIPIVYGEDVRDWSVGADPATKLKHGKMIWSASGSKALQPVRLFKGTWSNPVPSVELTSLDYVSAMTASAPFLIAITAEPAP